MNKEFTIYKYKILDDGFYLEIYELKTDKFGNNHYIKLSDYKYKENPNLVKVCSGVIGYPVMYDASPFIGTLLKTLLEENERLKWYKKVDKELE